MMVSLAVDPQVDLGPAHAGAADAEEDVVQGDGILGVAGVAALGTDFDAGRERFLRRRRRGFRR